VPPSVVDGKDTETGLIAAEGMEVVKQNCTGCHSAKLITQNHLSRERWEKTIRWMQKNQNLGDLGDNEKIILDYLEKNYGAVNTGRRKPLEKQVWYELK
jgi:mono/diheme cytochrome c family protein